MEKPQPNPFPNQFQTAFEKRIEDAGFRRIRRGQETLWRKPDERGILYDTAEALIEARKL